MKKIIFGLIVLLASTIPAFASGGLTRPQSPCQQKTSVVGVGAYATCLGPQGGNTNTPEYKACAANFITNYMNDNGCGTYDYKSAYPNIFN